MKCEKCGQNEANVHYSIQMNGESQSMRLCMSCAGQMGLDVSEDFGLWPFAGFMSQLAGSEPRRLKQEPGRQNACPVCGRTIMRIQDTGRMGCSQCYDHFASRLEPYLDRLYGNARHQGKIPASAGEALRGRWRIEELKTRLREAVDRQDYEQAAVLRDELKQLGGERL